MIEDWTIPPTAEFKRIHEDDEGFIHHPPIHRWHMMMKCVLNDYFLDGHHREIDFMKMDLQETAHFFHKIYFCGQEMGRFLYASDSLEDEEE